MPAGSLPPSPSLLPGQFGSRLIFYPLYHICSIFFRAAILPLHRLTRRVFLQCLQDQMMVFPGNIACSPVPALLL